MASRKAQTPQAAEAARDNTAQAPQTAERAPESAAQPPEQVAAAPEAPAPAGEEKTPEDQQGKEATDSDSIALEDVAVLAIRHRVAAWEQAALMRMMGWADGKMIADADYRAALAKLHGRCLGGGRMVCGSR